MEIKIKETIPEKREFKPLTIELSVETQEELYNLWHRFNSDPIEYNAKVPSGKDNSRKVQEELSKELRKLGVNV